MHVAPAEVRTATTSVLDEIKTGFTYVARSFPIRTTLTLLALMSIMGMPYTVLMPAIASKILHGGANTLGFLMTAAGVGALLGALYLASRASVGRSPFSRRRK